MNKYNKNPKCISTKILNKYMKMKREIILILLCCIVFSVFISLYLPNSWLMTDKEINLQRFKENFNTAIYKDIGLPDTTHTVNLPINTTYECENKCMPPARCSITGEQCSSDIDCCGCNPYTKEILEEKEKERTEGFTSYASNDTTYDTKSSANPPNYFKGIDLWSDSFKEGSDLYDLKHNPLLQTARYGSSKLAYILHYPERKTLSGDFIENGAKPYSLIN